MPLRKSLLLFPLLLAACGPHPIARVALLADLGPAASQPAPPTTLPATFRFDVRPTAQAALTLAQQMSRISADARYTSNLADLLTHNLASENALLLRQPDPETAARAQQVLAFNAAIADFLSEALAAPDSPQRDQWIRWALTPEHMQQVAAVYDGDVATRAHAARLLTDQQGPEADRLLARLIRDDDREVSLLAIDTAWDRTPSAPLVAALWEKGVTLPLQLIGVPYHDNESAAKVLNPAAPQRTIIIRGRAVPIGPNAQDYANRTADSVLAVDALLHYDSPLVQAKVEQFVIALTPPNADTTALARALSQDYGDVTINTRRLLAAYRPPQALPHILATLNAANGFNGGYGSINMNGRNYLLSPQVDLLAIAIELMGQTPDDYGVLHLANYGNRWVFDGSSDDQSKAVKRLMTDWTAHYKDYGAATPDLPKTTGAVQGPMNRGMWMEGID